MKKKIQSGTKKYQQVCLILLAINMEFVCSLFFWKKLNQLKSKRSAWTTSVNSVWRVFFFIINFFWKKLLPLSWHGQTSKRRQQTHTQHATHCSMCCIYCEIVSFSQKRQLNWILYTHSHSRLIIRMSSSILTFFPYFFFVWMPATIRSSEKNKFWKFFAWLSFWKCFVFSIKFCTCMSVNMSSLFHLIANRWDHKSIVFATNVLILQRKLNFFAKYINQWHIV